MWRDGDPDGWQAAAPAVQALNFDAFLRCPRAFTPRDIKQRNICKQRCLKKELSVCLSRKSPSIERHFSALLEQTGMKIVAEAGEEPDVFHKVGLHHVGPLPLGS